MKTLVILGLVLIAISAQNNYHGNMVLRINLESEKQLEVFEKLENEGVIDVWSEKALIGGYHDVLVTPSNYQEFASKMFNDLKTKYEVIIPNVQTLIDKEQDRQNSLPEFTLNKFLASNDDGMEFFSKYRKPEEFDRFLTGLNQKFPKLTKLFSIGKTGQGKNINCLLISTSEGSNTTKPSIVYNGGQHAREWISPMTNAYLANRMLHEYGKVDLTTKLINSINWYIVPIVNVDGYTYTWSDDRLWRKTRSVNKGSKCVGVDPNRNWDYEWTSGGSSSNPCSESYRGPKPFSEPEVSAIAKLTTSVPNLKAYIDFHSYSQLWMRPWGFSRKVPAGDEAVGIVNDACGKAVYDVHGSKYTTGRIAVTIYEASGSSVDYVFAKTNALSFAVELRDTGRQGFLLDAKNIVPTGEEVFAAAVNVIGSKVIE
ncbi:carboxypeptidase [Acrasis kona]|uniref:Carboxypeptidase n=1 Tax=Acrasis kona TaxID=1008807 RepID=A0AAW2YVD9_9EUKA